MRDTSCPNCGAENANEGRARVCYRCRFQFDRAVLDDGARTQLAALLAAGRPGHRVFSVRKATATLGLALQASGRDREAADMLGRALAEPGADPPQRELLNAHAAALLASGDLAAAVREGLTWAADDAEHGPGVIALVRDALTPATAEELVDWVDTVWVPSIDSANKTHVLALVLAGAANALLGHGTAATDRLRAAHELDAVAARDAWASWLAGSIARLSELPGGEAYALSLQARAAAALSTYDEARELADRVINEGMTAEGYPELEAYWLRARLPGRSDAERADDLVEVAQRYRWRDTAADLRRSIELCDSAIASCPERPTAYWHRAEALRLLAAAEGSTTGLGLIQDALATWDKGRKLDDPVTSWPWLVGCLVHRDAGQADAHRMRSWDATALADAVRCVFAEPGSVTGWTLVATQCQRLKLWPAARWAISQCVSRMDAWTPDYAFEAYNVFQSWLEVDAHGLLEYLPQLMNSFTALADEFRRFIDVAPLWVVDPLSPETIEATVGAMTEIDSGIIGSAFTAMMLEMIGEHDRAFAAVQKMEKLAEADPSDALLNLVNRVSALQWVGSEWRSVREQMDDPQLATAAERANADLHDALERGDLDTARSAYATTLAGITPTGAAIAAAEYRVLAERLRHRGAAEIADFAQGCSAGFEAFVADARMERSWSVAAVETDLDRRAIDADLPELAAAITAVHALVSELNRETLIRTACEAIALPIALDLSPDLVPADAADNWEQWTMFRDLIPETRENVQETLGAWCPGIRVRQGQESTRSYTIVLDGWVAHTGAVAGLTPPAPLPIAEWTDTAAWQEAVAALRRVLLTRPNAFFSPSIARWMLEDAHEENDAVALSAGDVVRVWRSCRNELDAGHKLASNVDLIARAQSPASGAELAR